MCGEGFWFACEYSGHVRDALIARGHGAISLRPIAHRSAGPHYQGDVMGHHRDGFDLMIAHPPCTYRLSSGMLDNARNAGTLALTGMRSILCRLM